MSLQAFDGYRWSGKDSSGTPLRISRLPLAPATARRLLALLERAEIHHPNLAALWASWARDRKGELHELSLAREVVHAARGDSPGASATIDTGMPAEDEATEWIVAALAPERTILERAQECGRQGHSGIPVDELLGYLTDLGSAIDFIHRIEPSGPRAHGWIQPQNIWLWGRTARLAGWEHMFVDDPRRAALSEGSDFAAPESRGTSELTPAADQYSLAACYMFLRTGQMPRPGVRPVSMQAAEYAVLARAMLDDPQMRYVNALDMVKALRGACGGETVSGAAIKTLMVTQDSKCDAPSLANVPAPKPRAAKTVTMVNEDLLSEIRQTASAIAAQAAQSISPSTPASAPTPTPPASTLPASPPRPRAEQTVMTNPGDSQEASKKPAEEPKGAKPEATPARKTPETVVMDNFFVAGPAAGFLPVPGAKDENPGSGNSNTSGSSGSQTVVMTPSNAPPPVSNPSVTKMISAALDSRVAESSEAAKPSRPATQTVRMDSSGAASAKSPSEDSVELSDDAPVNPAARTVRDIGNMTIRQDVSPTANTIHDVGQRASGEKSSDKVSGGQSPGEGDLLELPKSGAEKPAPQPIGSLGEYMLIERIGGGSMGQVYKAMHRYMQRLVAIKVLSENLSADDDAVHRFTREAETAARLTHPNIVTAYNAGAEGKQHYLVMEFVEGIDLFRTVDRGGPLSLRTALDYTIQAARGLEYAHQAGIVHRDIKPGNLMLDRAGVVKILDMGLARFFEGSGDDAGLVTRTGTIMGTLDYMPPEQAKNSKRADQRSDIYSLGCTMYYMLTGRAPYPARTLVDSVVAHRDQPIPKLADKVRPIDAPLATAKLQSAFERMLAKQPDDRFVSMKSAIMELEGALAALPASQIDPLSSTVITMPSDKAASTAEDQGPRTVLEVTADAPTIRSAPQGPSSQPTVIQSANSPTIVQKPAVPAGVPAAPARGKLTESGLSKQAWQMIAYVAGAAAILQLVLRLLNI